MNYVKYEYIIFFNQNVRYLLIMYINAEKSNILDSRSLLICTIGFLPLLLHYLIEIYS